jgi:drug/metabolite transporter (DMT)-like permease
MIGLVIAMFSGSFNCLSSIFVRKGMYHSGESFSPLPISNFAGTMFFGLGMLILDQTNQLVSLSWLGFGSLAAAGVLHFIAGRLLGYTGIRLLGANRANPITTSNILVSALLGIVFLGESVTIYLVLAILFIFGGIILISKRVDSDKQNISRGDLTKGLLATLGGALCWGSSPALVKIGLQEVSSPVVATFISYAAAFMVVGLLLSYRGNREKLRRLKRDALIPLGMSSVSVSAAHLLRYTAIYDSPISLVQVLAMSVNGLLVFPLSFLINRKIEVFNLRIIGGAVIVITGVLLIFLTA